MSGVELKGDVRLPVSDEFSRRPYTENDVRLEVAAMRRRSMPVVAAELQVARTALENARSEVSIRALSFARLVDRTAAVFGELFVFESLDLDEPALLELVKVPEGFQ